MEVGSNIKWNPINKGKTMSYINSWSECNVGDYFVEDTYNEVYQITGFANNNQPKVRVAGYQMKTEKITNFGQICIWPGNPSPLYDQSCIKIPQPNYIPNKRD